MMFLTLLQLGNQTQINMVTPKMDTKVGHLKIMEGIIIHNILERLFCLFGKPYSTYYSLQLHFFFHVAFLAL